jgi:hypothetical protein
VDELILRVLEGDSMGDVVACALLAGDDVELSRLLARIDEEMGARRIDRATQKLS